MQLSHQQYYDALQRAVQAYKHRSTNREEQLAFCHLIVKAAALYPKTDDVKKMKERRDMMQQAVLFLGKLTINELLQTFPLDKVYNGNKTGHHDYFNAAEAVEAYKVRYGLTNDDPLGDMCLGLLAHYSNTHVRAIMDEFALILLHTRPQFLNPFFSVAIEQQVPQHQAKPTTKKARLHQKLAAITKQKQKRM